MFAAKTSVAISTLLLIGVVSCQVSLKDTATNLQIKMTRLENCPMVDNDIKHSIMINKVNETLHTYTGHGTLPYDIGEDVTVVLDVDKWDEEKREWEKDFFHVKKGDVCNFLTDFLGETLFKIQDQINMPRNQCPFPKGYYEGNDVVVDLQDLALPKAFIGTLKAHVKVFKKEKIIMCNTAVVELF